MKPSGLCLLLLWGVVQLAPADNSTTTEPTVQEKYYPPVRYALCSNSTS